MKSPPNTDQSFLTPDSQPKNSEALPKILIDGNLQLDAFPNKTGNGTIGTVSYTHLTLPTN